MLRRTPRTRHRRRRHDHTAVCDVPTAATRQQPTAPKMQDAPGQGVPDPDAAQHLENLRAALRQERPDLYARLRRGGRPQLVVADPGQDGACETISHSARACYEAEGQYLWNTETRLPISPVTDPAAAALIVLRMLAVKTARV